MSRIEPNDELLLFRLGHLHAVLPRSEVQEIVKRLPITPLYLVAEQVLGMVNLRGDILTAIDPRVLLETKGRASDKLGRHMLIVHSGKERVALLVDEVEDVFPDSAGRLESPPSAHDYPEAAYFSAIWRRPDQPLAAVLDLEKLLA